MKHEMVMNVKKSEVTKAGVEFTLKDENGKSGTLEVRLGSLTWYAGSKTQNNKCVVSWNDFDAFMKKHPAK